MEQEELDPVELERKRREDFYHLRYYAGPYVWFDPLTWPNAWKVGAICFFSNWAGGYLMARWYKRPWYSGIRMKLLTSTLLGIVGYAAGSFRDYHLRTRDAVIEHYMQIHPEDFKHLTAKEGRKIKDLFMPWTPVRVQHNVKPKD